MIFEPLSLLAAIVPTIKYAFTRFVDYKTGGPKPSNAAEAISLGELEIRKLEAVAKLDNADGASRWVTNLRALQRPIVVFIVLAVWAFIAIQNQISVELVSELASVVFFYLFGERTSMAIMRGAKK